MSWLSFSIRYLVNVEDLNNVESAGNYIRHRRAPVIFRDNNSYVISYVPAISGEMIAHGYQSILADIATKSGLKVDALARQGAFIKRGAGDKVHKGSNCENEDGANYELCVIKEDVVEDVAGFMNPNKLAKRVSNIAFSYMIPSPDSVKSVGIMSQFHVRYVTKELIDEQSLFNVEVASASYVLTGYLNVDGIGCTQTLKCDEKEGCRTLCIDDNKEKEESDDNERKKRILSSLDALNLTLTQFLFGAKQSRFKPIIGIEAVALSLSEKPFNLLPITLENGKIDDYINLTKSTINSFAESLGIKNPPSFTFYAQDNLMSSIKGESMRNYVGPFDVIRKAVEDKFKGH